MRRLGPCSVKSQHHIHFLQLSCSRRLSMEDSRLVIGHPTCTLEVGTVRRPRQNLPVDLAHDPPNKFPLPRAIAPSSRPNRSMLAPVHGSPGYSLPLFCKLTLREALLQRDVKYVTFAFTPFHCSALFRHVFLTSDQPSSTLLGGSSYDSRSHGHHHVSFSQGSQRRHEFPSYFLPSLLPDSLSTLLSRLIHNPHRPLAQRISRDLQSEILPYRPCHQTMHWLSEGDCRS